MSARPAEAIVGDWTGEVASKQEREALAYRELRVALMKVYRHALEQREHWAKSTLDGAIPRAVAYQSMAGLIQRAVEIGDRSAGPTKEVGRG